jgi:hypothetical protein
MLPSVYSMSGFAAVGLAIAISYLMLSTTCAAVLALARWRRTATSGLRHTPGMFIALEAQRVARRLRRHNTAVLLFCACFGVLMSFGRHDEWHEFHPWAPVAIALLLAVAGTVAAAKGLALARYQGRLRSLLQTTQRVAQRLEEVQRRGYEIFHAVPVGERVVDHVIVGTNGVFAVQLIVCPRAGATSASMARGSLLFAPAHGEFRLQPAIGAFARLGRELGRAVGHPIKVVPTLIAVGVEVTTRDDDRYLLLNEQTCVTLVGWKDSAAFLMDDEIARISGWLSARCRQRGRNEWLAPGGAPHPCVGRPAWL